MISLETSAEIPWISRDLRTSGTSTVPVWDIGGESLLRCQEESAVFFRLEGGLGCWSTFASEQATMFELAILEQQ